MFLSTEQVFEQTNKRASKVLLMIGGKISWNQKNLSKLQLCNVGCTINKVNLVKCPDPIYYLDFWMFCVCMSLKHMLWNSFLKLRLKGWPRTSFMYATTAKLIISLWLQWLLSLTGFELVICPPYSHDCATTHLCAEAFPWWTSTIFPR